MVKYFCNPLNISYAYQVFDKSAQDSLSKGKVFLNREAADPSVVLFKGIYYLFPSMSAGFYTSLNLVDWNFHALDSSMPILDYAPDVRVIGDYLYFTASKRGEVCPFYRTKDPIKGTWEKVEGSMAFWDPNLFEDEDNRLYLYWGCAKNEPLRGVELDKESLAPIGDPQDLIGTHPEKIGFERNGENHFPKSEEEIEAAILRVLKAKLGVNDLSQVPDQQLQQIRQVMGGDAPYLEGAWMTKYLDTYYLQYSVPGTQYNTYADGVYVSKSPLGPFTLAQNNPFSYKPGGFVVGAGHGSTFEDEKGQWWHASTISISQNHDFERRLGLWKAGFDDDGELWCDQAYGVWRLANQCRCTTI
ncbi:family 43 glycosylhydrolase [Streptococcus sp. S784/96/1]|uniref:family 43 glycosylhydrolase n=1 Tax=Streptococcus sp. S784/96/1 TaxID=2653499 RepID=UPI00192E44DF|nr:family 43 glycosylhydrolase [Streptococcus sp. S784/96/1]